MCVAQLVWRRCMFFGGEHDGIDAGGGTGTDDVSDFPERGVGSSLDESTRGYAITLHGVFGGFYFFNELFLVINPYATVDIPRLI